MCHKNNCYRMHIHVTINNVSVIVIDQEYRTKSWYTQVSLRSFHLSSDHTTNENSVAIKEHSAF